MMNLSFRVLFKYFIFILVCSILMACAQKKQPNILLIIIDDLGYADLGCYGNTSAVTPAIDKLAGKGTRFMHFYSNSPIGAPSRVALQTGQYPQKFGINSEFSFRKLNQMSGMADYLPDTVETLARVLQANGYRTGHFGKWQLGGGFDIDDAPLPEQMGFDKALVSSEGLGNRILINDEGLSKASALLDTANFVWANLKDADRMFTDSAIAFMKASGAQPCYVQLAYKALKGRYGTALADSSAILDANKQYYNTLRAVDSLIAKVVAELELSGLLKQTVIILTSDNGPDDSRKYYSRHMSPPGSAGNLRGRKWSLYEGGIRVPFIVFSGDGRIPSRVDNTTLAAAIDVFPTICNWVGAQSSIPENIDGIDISKAWLGEDVIRNDFLFWEYPGYPRPGDMNSMSPRLAVRRGDWKLFTAVDTYNVQLYNLKYDPFESTNVAANDPVLSDSLANKVIEWYHKNSLLVTKNRGK